jgi:putative transposase
MKYNPEIHHRRSIRLKGYDYSKIGAYFITICTQNRECLFGEIIAGEMRLNAAGDSAMQCWQAIPDHFPHAESDEWVIMPNHVHGIVLIVDVPVGAKNFSPLQQPNFSPLQPGTSKTIGSIVRGFKIGVTKWMRNNTPIHDVWQRNYWEHVVRNESELDRIREYIRNNPVRWELDKVHPGRAGGGGGRGEKFFAPTGCTNRMDP